MPYAGNLHVIPLGLRPYNEIWQAMQRYTDRRHPDSQDQIWLCEHPPVFTLGQAGKLEHLLDPGEIPVIRTDRGGQVTYHGPGQLVAYLLLDLRRAGIGIRGLVTHLEEAVIALLAQRGIEAGARRNAPGVYVAGAKITSIGLRVRHGCSFHGLSLNVAMDLQPFHRINPCGYPGLVVTRLKDHTADCEMPDIARDLSRHLARGLGYTLSFADPTESIP